MDDTITPVLPEALSTFISDGCRLPVETLRARSPDELSEPARRLLVHQRDMTSTLAEFHGSELRVDVLRQEWTDDFYLREVFLRTVTTDVIVEYGVIAIAMARFTPEQQHAIAAGETPLGGLLHRFNVEFASAPIGYFALPAGARTNRAFAALETGPCYGRFNHLATPAGEPIAWIMEILPAVAAR